MGSVLKNFPYLEREEFEESIWSFMLTYGDHLETHQNMQCSVIKVSNQPNRCHEYLQITLPVEMPPPAEECCVEDTQVEDADPTSFSRPLVVWRGKITYHIIYSATWQVPVMYLRVTNPLGEVVMDVEKVQGLLVRDKETQETMSGVEFGGALGIQDHPYNQQPYLYLHPCHTATLLKNVSGGTNAGEYLRSWLSLVGSAVGVSLPCLIG